MTSCKKDISEKEIIKSETHTPSSKDYENTLQKDLEKSINNSKVKIIKVNDKEVSKEEALKIHINDVSSTTFIKHKPDSITFKIILEN